MTTHVYHQDTHTHGLAPECPRCQEHAEHPAASLDSINIARLLRGEVHTPLDRKALEALTRSTT